MKRQQAVQALREASIKRVAVVELLKNFTEGEEENETNLDANSFAHFLRDCGLISYDDLAVVLKTSSQLNIELVRILIPMNLIDIAVASRALDALAQVKNGKVDYAVAVFAMQLTNCTGCSLPEALVAAGASPPLRTGRILLGELVARSGVASEIEILAAVEAALVTGQRLGEALLSSGAISLLTLKNALEIQDLLSKGIFDRDYAIFVLKHLTSDGVSLADFALKTDLFKDQWPGAEEILELLYLAKIIDETSILEAHADRASYGMDPLRALLATDRLSTKNYQVAREIHLIVEDGRLNSNDALNALKAYYSEGVSLIDYMRALDVKKLEQAAHKQSISMTAGDKEVKGLSTKIPKFMAALANIVSSTLTFFPKPSRRMRKLSISNRSPMQAPRFLGNSRTSYSHFLLSDLERRL